LRKEYRAIASPIDPVRAGAAEDALGQIMRRILLSDRRGRAVQSRRHSTLPTAVVDDSSRTGRQEGEVGVEARGSRHGPARGAKRSRGMPPGWWSYDDAIRPARVLDCFFESTPGAHSRGPEGVS